MVEVIGSMEYDGWDEDRVDGEMLNTETVQLGHVPAYRWAGGHNVGDHGGDGDEDGDDDDDDEDGVDGNPAALASNRLSLSCEHF